MKVVLQRTESQDEYGRRLAGLVMNRLRLPRARAVFAATLVRALRGVSEANEVMVVVMAILSLISFCFLIIIIIITITTFFCHFQSTTTTSIHF